MNVIFWSAHGNTHIPQSHPVSSPQPNNHYFVPLPIPDTPNHPILSSSCLNLVYSPKSIPNIQSLSLLLPHLQPQSLASHSHFNPTLLSITVHPLNRSLNISTGGWRQEKREEEGVAPVWFYHRSDLACCQNRASVFDGLAKIVK